MARNKKISAKTNPKSKKMPADKKTDKTSSKQGEKNPLESIKSTYVKRYKELFLIPIILFLISAAVLANTYFQTGEFMRRDVTLKGGIAITIETTFSDLDVLESHLYSAFPESSINLRTFESRGVVTGIIVEASDVPEDDLINSIEEIVPLDKDNYSTETMGSSLGESFFQEMFKSLVVAFLFMGAVFFFYFSDNTRIKFVVMILSLVNFFMLFSASNNMFWIFTSGIIILTFFLYIKYNLPTMAALFSAFLDIFITVGIMDILGIRLTAGGIAAYLMLIGYSIDTSILLSTKMVKEKTTDIIKSLFGAMKTGFTMSAAGIATALVSFLLTNNVTLKQIMLILLVGLIIDLITTWIGNVAILRYYMEKRK